MVLLTSLNWVRAFTQISDNLQDKFLQSAIRESQEIGLQGIIGTDLYIKLQTLVDSGDIELPDNKTYKDLLDLSQYYLAYSTIAKLCVITTFKVNNIGVNTTTDDNVQVTSLKDTLTLENYYTGKADFYQKRIQDFCWKNKQQLTELNSCSQFKINPNLYTNDNTCGIWLGNARGKRSK